MQKGDISSSQGQVLRVSVKKQRRGRDQLTQVQVEPKQSSEGLRHHDDRVAEVGEVHHEQRQGSHGGKKELVPPSQVQHVISKAQEDHAADGQQCTDQLHKLLRENAQKQVKANDQTWDKNQGC